MFSFDFAIPYAGEEEGIVKDLVHLLHQGVKSSVDLPV